jgi:hypothetical protein
MGRVVQSEMVAVAQTAIHFDATDKILAAQGAGPR